MKTPELETISIFSKDLALTLTINQISKKLDKSYAFTNKYIREFLDEGILQKKVVGSAILCSLNFSNEKTLGLLMLNSIEEKQQFLHKVDKKTLELINTIKKTGGVKSLFFINNNLNIICENKTQTLAALASINSHNHKIAITDENEFKLGFKNIDMQNLTIIEGYESFWRLISEMMS